MNLIHSRPPHVRSHESNFSVMGDMVISLVPLYLMAYFFYGSRTLVLGAVSVITCTVLDFPLYLPFQPPGGNPGSLAGGDRPVDPADASCQHRLYPGDRR